MIGQLIANRYEILQETEPGLIWTLYKARDKVTGRFLALRFLNPEIAAEPGVLDEAKANVARISRIQHTALEKVLGFEESAGANFLVAEFNSGSSLEDRIKRLSSYSVPVAIGTIIEAAEALHALHSNDIIHGDLSARSIYATATEGVKVTIPGFWKAYGHSARAAVTVLRSISPYLAPEVSAGSMPTVESDIYALGVVLWQLLAGRLPYQGDSPATIAAKHNSAPYPSLRVITASVPVPLDEIVRKCMAKRPEDRYPDAQLLIDDLKTLLDALRFGRPLTWPLQPTPAAATQRVVAPDLNVANPKAKQSPKESNTDVPKQAEREYTDGLPAWINGLGYVVFLAVIMAIASWFYYSMNKPNTVVVPNMIGRPFAAAKKELESMNLNLRAVGEIESDKYPKGTIVTLRPAPGNETRAYQFVDAMISKGSRYVQVPTLRGKTLSEAKSLLERMELEMSQEFEYVADRDLDRDQVAGQVPAPGKKVTRYSKIKLLIANGDRTGETYIGKWSNYKVSVPVPDGTDPVTVSILKSDARSVDQEVYRQKHDPGELVVQTIKGYGDVVRFQIFIDGVLVKSVDMSGQGEEPEPTDQPTDKAKSAEEEPETSDTTNL